MLQLTDTADGARFWWQYAAGAGQPGAAYWLYLHHLAAGEDTTASWWHQQTDNVQPPSPPPGPHTQAWRRGGVGTGLEPRHQHLHLRSCATSPNRPSVTAPPP
ncbi:hypothetical protein [Streptomyces sp. DSM 118148]|uniref:hypothetical protein n=1 Tax=Streptomyces sp. DSM 118148 TaxID=3448667 RepID=UPI0040401775